MDYVHIVIFLFSVFISAVSQILLKISADKHYKSKKKEYLNLNVVVAYAAFFTASLLTIIAYRKVPLSMGFMLETTGYLWVTILGYMVLREKVSVHKTLGLIIIVFGIFLSGNV